MYTQPNIAVVSVNTDLDVRGVPRVKAQIEQLIDSGCRRIVLNMSEVSYIDSCGMGFIVCAVRRMKTLGGLMSLTNVQPTAFKALVRMGLIDFMPISTCAAKSRVTPLAPGTHPSFQTTFRVDPNKMCDARSRAIALLKTLPFTSDQKFDIELAVGEAIGNAVDHACEKGVLTTVSAYPDRVVIDVSDCGGGFSISDEEEPPETGQFAERGRGVKLMRLLMDAVSIQEKPSGNGTIVRLVKMWRLVARARARAGASTGRKSISTRYLLRVDTGFLVRKCWKWTGFSPGGGASPE